MKSNTQIRLSVLSLALLCAAAGSSALTLGQAQSLALLGQPLDVTIPVDMGPGENMAVQCFDADVYYGDAQLGRDRIEVALQPQTSSVRVMAHVNLNEPVVTVYFRAGCKHALSRKYVLLADVADETEGSALPRVSMVRTPAGASAALDLKASQAVSGAPRAAAPHGRSTQTMGKTRKAAQAKKALVVLERDSSPTPQQLKAAQKSRLKLTALGVGVERDPVLRSSDFLMDLPLEDLQKRAQAIATWRALNATPEEVMRQEAQLAALDSDIKSLGELTVKNQAALMDLAARLEEARAQRYRNPLVYGLATALLACIAFAGYAVWRWRQQPRRPGPWWQGNGGPGEHDDGYHTDMHESSIMPVAPVSSGKRAPKGTASSADAADSAGVDVDLNARESAFTRLVEDSQQDGSNTGAGVLLPATPVPPGDRDFSYSVNATLRAINTQEMLDERQQAEFFMTLGQQEEAVQLLEDSIDHSIEANPLVYLDLLKILHTLGRKTEYEHYRQAFNAVFSGRVLPFAQFAAKGHTLEAYDDVCQHIAALWPTENALNFVEDCLVRTHDGMTQEFDLDAFRDLLTLHGVLLRLFATTDPAGVSPVSTFKAQALGEGGHANRDSGGAAGISPDQTTPLAQTRQGAASVDLDLSHNGNLMEFEEITLAPREPTARK